MSWTEQVGRMCDAIPPGRVATYGQLARLCGRPGAARQVGQALGRGASRCAHRVVNSRGFLSGAAAFLTEGLQRRLLEAEGVEVLPGERVDLRRFGWRPEECEGKERAYGAEERARRGV